MSIVMLRAGRALSWVPVASAVTGAPSGPGMVIVMLKREVLTPAALVTDDDTRSARLAAGFDLSSADASTLGSFPPPDPPPPQAASSERAARDRAARARRVIMPSLSAAGR